jgi:hypothetical protein
LSVRRAAHLVALLVMLGSASCAAEEGRGRRGSFVDTESPRGRPLTPAPLWRHADDVGSLVVVREHQRSSHFLGHPDVELRVNQQAAAYGKSGESLGEGALVVATHALPEGAIRFAMEKRRGASPDDPSGLAWEYTVVDETSHAVEHGRIATCVRCHEEAAHDEIFGPPGL